MEIRTRIQCKKCKGTGRYLYPSFKVERECNECKFGWVEGWAKVINDTNLINMTFAFTRDNFIDY